VLGLLASCSSLGRTKTRAFRLRFSFCYDVFTWQPPLLPVPARDRRQARLPENWPVQLAQHRVCRAAGSRVWALHLQRAAQAVLAGAAAAAAATAATTTTTKPTTTGVVGRQEYHGFFEETVAYAAANITVVVIVGIQERNGSVARPPS
jgi:hypothetical protein